ncbi:MATE family efflux transporter [Vineibacter terrae]|nr:MATE family efflux transporter [Vineibacter terrae]
MIVPCERARTILELSWPVILALVAQNAMSLITIALVGRLGDAALAGIAVGGTVFSMMLAMLFALDTAVQAAVARRAGAGDMPGMAAVLADGVAISLPAGLLLAAAAYVGGPAVLAMMVDDPAVVATAIDYLRALSPTLLFIGAGFAFSAYWNGRGMPALPLRAICVQLPCHGALSYALIFGAFGCPRLDTAGAGLGAAAAALIALAVHIRLITRRASISLRPMASGIATLLSQGLPVSIQQAFLYAGVVVFFTIVARLGTREIAAANVMIALMLLSILASTGVGIAAATLVGQALGRRDVPAVRRWGWDASRVGALVVMPLSVAIMAAPHGTLALFVVDEATIDLAATPLRLMALSMCIDAVGRVLVFALRGAGVAQVPAMITFALQWGAQLPLCWYVGVQLGHGLAGIAAVRLLLCAVESTVMVAVWGRTLAALARKSSRRADRD